MNPRVIAIALMIVSILLILVSAEALLPEN